MVATMQTRNIGGQFFGGLQIRIVLNSEVVGEEGIPGNVVASG
jgi:hypothetical protein